MFTILGATGHTGSVAHPLLERGPRVRVVLRDVGHPVTARPMPLDVAVLARLSLGFHS